MISTEGFHAIEFHDQNSVFRLVWLQCGERLEGESLGAVAKSNITEELWRPRLASGSRDGTWRESEREFLKGGGRGCFSRMSPNARPYLTCVVLLPASCPLPLDSTSKDTISAAPTQPLSHREGQADLRILSHTPFPLTSSFFCFSAN